MLRPIRRVVTGLNAEGRSIIVSDEPASFTGELPFWPGRGTTGVWSTDQAPASNEDDQLSKPLTSFPPRGSGGVSFMIMHMPPESETEAMPPEQRAQATSPVACLFPEAFEVDTSKCYQMHATDTIDFTILLTGEVTVLLDEGEVTLKPLDCSIQRGVNHGWVNRCKETAIVCAAVVDAQPLTRGR